MFEHLAHYHHLLKHYSNQVSKIRGHINMWITMVISGLWHGAVWHYVVWGALHAFFFLVLKEF